MRYKETIKSLVLAGLICSALLLAGRAWVYGALAPRQQFSLQGMVSLMKSGMQGEYITLRYGSSGAELSEDLFLPAMIEVNRKGSRGTVNRSASQLYEAHAIIRQQLLAAMPSDRVRMEQADGQDWENALEQDGVWVDFQASIPFQLYGELLGIQPGPLGKIEPFQFRWMYVSIGKDSGLYLKSQDGSVRRISVQIMAGAGTALDELALLQQGSTGYLRVGESSAQTREYAQTLGLGDEQRLPDSVLSTRVLWGANPLAGEEGGAHRDSLLKVFSIRSANPQVENSDGSTVYIENFSTLKLWPQGRVEYRVTGEAQRGISILSAQNSSDGVLSVKEMVEGVYALLGKLDKKLLGGDALGVNLGFAGMGYNSQEQSYVLRFRYQCDGVEVYQSEMEEYSGYPVEVEVREGYITRVELLTRTYTDSGIAAPNLRPETVLAAFAGRQQAGQGGELRLMYLDEGQEMVTTSYVLQGAGGRSRE